MKKLILFDIDGTLVYHVGKKTSWVARYMDPMKNIYGVEVPFGQPGKHDGSIERKVAWDELSEFQTVAREEFLQKFPAYIDDRIRVFDRDAAVETLHQSIPDAVRLVRLLAKRPQAFVLGLLTGNAKKISVWKLTHAKFPYWFSFGLYGEEADDRIELARLVFEKAKQQLHWDPMPEDIVVIGDTIHDIRCGKAIGARVIAVTTGGHERKTLEDEKPDLLVDSLMDQKVLDFFQVPK